MSKKRGSVYLLSLGCPKNLADSEGLLRRISPRADIVDSPGRADYLVVNTCGFIRAAKEESIGEILGLLKAKKNGQKVVVMGCLPARYGEELKKEIPEVDAWFGVGQEDAITRYLGLETGCEKSADFRKPTTFPFAYVKIAEGCGRRCSFCSIPSIRGPFRSRRPEEILQESASLLGCGIKEIVFVSQDSAGYDFKGYRLHQLLKDAASASGDFRIRVMYLYPPAIDEKLLDAFSGEGKIMKYLDMPLQHASPKILRLMGRGGAVKDMGKLPSRLRRAIPGVALRTAFIVGFPGETEEDFRLLIDYVEEQGFDHAGAFTYSREEGTAAAALRGQVPRALKQRRYAELMKAQSAISLEKNKALLGRKVRILVDSTDLKYAVGRLPSQAPEIDGAVIVPNAGGVLQPGDFADIIIKEAYDYDLQGEAV